MCALKHYNKHHEHPWKKLHNMEWTVETLNGAVMDWIYFVLERDHFALAQKISTEEGIERLWRSISVGTILTCRFFFFLLLSSVADRTGPDTSNHS